MALIPEPEARLLQAHFERALRAPVRIDLFVEREKKLFRAADECEYCDEARQLMGELAALSPQIELVVHSLSDEPDEARRLGVERAPSIVLSGAARGRVSFVGLPLGHALTILIETLVAVADGDSRLEDEARQALGALDADVRLELFVTPSCPYCPAVARLVNKLAIESARVSAEVVEVDQFPALGEQYDLEGVPTLVVNGRIALAGMQPEAHLLGAVVQAARAVRGGAAGP